MYDPRVIKISLWPKKDNRWQCLFRIWEFLLKQDSYKLDNYVEQMTPFVKVHSPKNKRMAKFPWYLVLFPTFYEDSKSHPIISEVGSNSNFTTDRIKYLWDKVTTDH